MKQAIQLFHQLCQSTNKNIKDSSVVAALEQSLFCLDPAQLDVQVYCRLMLSVYDLSNHHTFVSVPAQGSNASISIHGVSIKLKILAMKMIGCLVKLLSGRTSNRLDRELEIQALEIMVLSIRICLDHEADWIADVMECWKYCEILYEHSLMKGYTAAATLNEEMHLLYILDKMDILRLIVGQPFFPLNQLQQCLQTSNQLLTSGRLPAEQEATAKSYIENIVTEITLKLLRSGNTDCLGVLHSYLPEKLKNILTKVNSKQREGFSDAGGVGQVYELYWQICADGMDAVSIEFLEKFISKESVFNGEQIFEAILLLSEPSLLEIWFNEANRRTMKPKNYVRSYECFVSLLICFLGKKTEVSDDGAKDRKKLDSLVKLCKQVILSLIREPKDTKVEVNTICTYLLRMAIKLVMEMYDYESCVEMFENLYLISCQSNFAPSFTHPYSLHLVIEQTQKSIINP